MHPSDVESASVRDPVETASNKLLNPSHDTLFDTRVSPLTRFAGASNLLRCDPSPHLQRAEAESMSLTETSFFRDPCLFDTLRTAVLPALIRLRANTRRLRIWSAACSTGQEAFSLAIVLDHVIPGLADWDIEILGTDISRSAIDCAQRGHFRMAEIHRSIAPHLLAQYFTPRHDEWILAPRIISLCRFRVANLCAPIPHLPSFDLILLRNVLLYFSPADRASVLNTMHRHLAPEGCLVLGGSEQAEDSTTLFHPQVIGGTYLYRPVNAT